MRGLLIVIFALMLSVSGYAQIKVPGETTSRHFAIQYASDYYAIDELEMVKSELESAYRLLNEKYGLRVVGRVPVYLSGSEASYFRKVVARERWGAVYSDGTLYLRPLSYIQKNGGLTITARHALAHVMLQPAVANGCPPWLVESFAVNSSGEFEILSKPSETSVKFFTDLNEALQSVGGSAELEVNYYMVGLAVRYFEERFGSRKIAELFNSFDGRSLAHQVMEKVFGLPFNDLQYRWAKYVDSRINVSK